jgi:hypothetical protein
MGERTFLSPEEPSGTGTEIPETPCWDLNISNGYVGDCDLDGHVSLKLKMGLYGPLQAPNREKRKI